MSRSRSQPLPVALIGLLLMTALNACGDAATTPTVVPPVMTALPPTTTGATAPTTLPPSATVGALPTVPPTPAAAPPTTLRVAIGADEGTLQPYTYVTGYPGWNMLSLVYDALFIMDADNLPQPWLATGDAISADGKVHTLTLRPDVQWQDGQPLTSADVKFSYEFYKQYKQSRWTPPVRTIVSITTPTTTTVVITLPAPNPSFAIQPLADVPIIPQHLWAGVTDPKTFANNVGSGPYKLAEYKEGQFYRFTANPTYFAGKPTVAELVLPIIKGATGSFAAIKTGEIGATVRSLAPELVKDFQSNPDLKIQRGPGFSTTLLQFNDTRAPWDKREVRQAVALAINTQQLVDTVLLGFGTPGNPGWLHPASPFHDPAVKGAYDVAKAGALLDSLGYKDTNNDGVREAAGAEMVGTLLVYADNPTRLRSAELIAAGLKGIGINLKVTALDPDSVDAKVWPDFDVAKGRDFDLAMWGWSAPVQVNPARMIGLVASDPAIGTNNIGGYKNPVTDQIAATFSVTTDPAQQKTLARQLEAQIAADVPFVVLFYEDGNYVYRPAAYDGWVYQKGQGIFHKLSFLPPVQR